MPLDLGTPHASAGSMPSLGARLVNLLRIGDSVRDLLVRRRPSRAPRLVRRTIVHCPETGAPVEIDLLMARTGGPDMVLRCSAHAECPPACDQACRKMAEAVVGPARALIICPPGSGPPEEIG
jgi:hypothetical protein